MDGLDSDYLASVSDLPQDHQIPNPEDELGLAKLMLKQIQLEDNLERGRKFYVAKAKESPEVIDLLNKDYEGFKKETEEKLEHVNSVLDVYVTREREKEIRDRDALLAKQMQIEEEERALEEQRKAQIEYERIQEAQRKRLEEAKKMQFEEQRKQLEEARKRQLDEEQEKELQEIKKLQQLEDRIKRARIKQEEFQRKLKEVKAEEDLRDKLWANFQNKKEEMKLKEQDRERWLQQNAQYEPPLGRNEETIPPNYRRRKEKQTEESVPKGSSEEKNQKENKRKPETPHWQFDKDEQSREVYNKHMRRGETSSLNIYCARCDRDHWGPCECVICGKIGHDENDCPQLEDEKSYLDQLKKQEEERLKRKRLEPCWRCKKIGHVCPDPKARKEEKPKRPKEIFCNFCEGDGHVEQNCSIKKETLERPKLPREYTDDQLEKEIEERVRKLKNIGNELNKRERNVTFKGNEEPRDDINAEKTGKRAHQPKAGQGGRPPRRPDREEEYRQPPRRENMQPGGGGGDDPDPGDEGDEEPTDESEEENSEEEETTSSSSSEETTSTPEEREAMESLESSLMSMWDIYGTRITKPE